VNLGIGKHLLERLTSCFGPPGPQLPPDEEPGWTVPGMEIRLLSREGSPMIEIRGSGSGRGSRARLQFTEVRTIAQANLLVEYLREVVEARAGAARVAGRDASSTPRRGPEQAQGVPDSLRLRRDSQAR
jgi:hypothetical protein